MALGYLSKELLFCRGLLIFFLVIISSAVAQGAERYILKLETNGGVSSNPPAKTVFTVSVPTHITKIFTYHYNGGQGATPGTIGLKNIDTDAIVGTWNVIGLNTVPGLEPGAVWPTTASEPKYLYWTVQPNVDIPAGTYEVVDSSPSTWSYNAETQNMGIAWVYGYDAVATALAAPQNLRYSFNGSMLTISWDAASGAAGYKLGLGIGSKSNWADYNIGNITQIGPFDASGIPGTYYLAVKATSGSQDSAYSNEITVAIMSAPQNLTYTLNGSMLTINWGAVSGATGYKLGLGIGSKANWADYDIGNITRIGPFDASSIPGTYYLAVRATNAAQDSGYSNEITIMLDSNGPENVLQRVLENQTRGDLEAMYRDIAMGTYGVEADNKTKEILGAVKSSATFSGLKTTFRGTLYDKDHTIAYVRLETSITANNGRETGTLVNGYLAVLIKQDGAWKVLTLMPDDLLNLEIVQRRGPATAAVARTASAGNLLSAAELNRRIDEIFKNPDLSINSDHAMKTLVKHPLNYIPFVGTASNADDAVEAGSEAVANLWKGIKGDGDSMTVGIVKIGETGIGIISIVTPPIPLTQIPADTVKELLAQLAIYRQKLTALRNLRHELATAQNDPDVVLTNLRLTRLSTVNYTAQGFELTEEGAEAPLTVRKVKVLSDGIGNSLGLKLVGDMYIPSASNSQTITDYLSSLGLDISQTKGDIITEIRQPAAQICRHCDKIVDNFHNDTKVWWTTTCNKGYDSFTIRLTNKAVQTETVFPLEVTTFMNDQKTSNMITSQATDVCPLTSPAWCGGHVTVRAAVSKVGCCPQTITETVPFWSFYFGAGDGGDKLVSGTLLGNTVTTAYADSRSSGTLTVALDAGRQITSLSVSGSDLSASISLGVSTIPMSGSVDHYVDHDEASYYVQGAGVCNYIQSLTYTSPMTAVDEQTLLSYSCDGSSLLSLKCYFYP